MSECKSVSMMWKIADKIALWKFKEKLSTGKVLATIFWDHNGVLLLKYCPASSTVTSVSNFDTLIFSQKTIKSKHPGLLKRKVILLHDNTTPHSAKFTHSLFNQLKWDVFLHLAYSPDSVPSDYSFMLSIDK